MFNDLDNYFRTGGKVYLPGLGEEIVLPRGVWFRYDGEVPTLAGNLARTELVVRGLLDLNRSRLREVLDWPMDIAAALMRRKQRFGKYGRISDQPSAYCFPREVELGRGVSAYVIAKKDRA